LRKLKINGAQYQIEVTLAVLYMFWKNMQSALRIWSKRQFGAVTEELNKLRRDLEEVQAWPVVNRDDSRLIKDRMDELLYQEEIMWLHCSRVSWLKEGTVIQNIFISKLSGGQGRIKSGSYKRLMSPGVKILRRCKTCLGNFWMSFIQWIEVFRLIRYST
jgi:hypothetical protein